jgi:DNA excision repair protein ERCC-3
MENTPITTKVKELLDYFDNLQQEINTNRGKIADKFSEISEGIKMTNFNSDKVKDFWDQPYAIIPRRTNEWYVICPSFVDFHIGWLEKTVRGWNYFIVDKYATWLGDVPKEIREKFQFKEPLKLTVSEGTIQPQDEDTKQKVLKRYSKFVRNSSEGIKIKKGYEFQVLAEMIADGILPFVPKKVTDLKETKMEFELRDYQKEAWENFLKLGAVGIFWPYGAGKTFLGLWALAHLPGKKLVVVPTTTLKDQWQDRIREFIPGDDTVEVITYMGYNTVKGNEYELVIFDEAHRLPANTFSRLATLRTKYRIGLSATPHREDGRENFIFALTGFPLGIEWGGLMEKHIVNKPAITLYLINGSAWSKKIDKINELLDDRKTIIYSYWLDLGEEIAKKLKIPFVNGSTKNRLEILKTNKLVVMSSVGGEGISIPELERIIEVGFLYGSRREEGQLMGRLFHSAAANPEHIIIMTEDEYQNYDKRLNAAYEKGFRIRVMR